MAFVLKITRRAERDLEQLYEDISAGQSDAALLWYRGLRRAILTLEEHPARCPITPETKKLRHLLYGRKPHIYRVIFRILMKRETVEVLHIRPGARRPFNVTGLT